MEECQHEEQALRHRTYANGITHVVLQCLDCGSQVRCIPKKEVTQEQRDTMTAWDESIREAHRQRVDAYWQKVRDQRQHEFEARRQATKDDYAAYLQTPTWRKQRNKRLAMDGGRCQAQLDGCTGHATEVHHLDYKLRPEPIFNLVSVCRTCHHQISVMEGRIDPNTAA